MTTPSSSPLKLLLATMLPPALSSAQEARGRVGELCQGWPAPAQEVARLLTSELVTNAVLHGGGEVGLTVRGSTDDLRVEVSDHNPELVPDLAAQPRRDDRDGGRGLAIVAALADDWGVDPDGDGKTVWFLLHPSAGLPGR